MARGIPISAMVLMMPCALQAQERLVIEEVIVTGSSSRSAISLCSYPT
jgi:hypothetical protein